MPQCTVIANFKNEGVSVISRVFALAGLILILGTNLSAEPLKLKVNAEAAILMNADTGQILYEKNARSLYYPASITKIATAAYTLQKKGGELDHIVTADQESIASISAEAKKRANYTLPAYWVEQGSNHIGIKKGEELTLRNLLYGMMLASGNDAANVIAQYTGGTIPNFVAEMNAYLKEIGCQNTTFYNPHGLHHPKHQTTAYDMAILTRHALKNPTFCQIVSTVRYTRPKTNKQESTTLVQSNRLLRTGKYYYPKAIGVKTGYTSAAMKTFVAAAKQGDRTLIAVLLKSSESNAIFTDAAKMFDVAFNQALVRRTLLKAGPQKFVLELPGATKPVKTYLKEDLIVEYYPAEEHKYKCLLYWDEVTPPIAKDSRIGQLKLLSENANELQVVPLYAQEEVKTTWIQWFKSWY